jgi:hypothetical protein
MIPNNVIESVREGDLGGDAIAMSFDENSFAHLMSVLTDLYEDPEMAVIREYSTNARDAHIEAGCPDKPIEISTPTAIFPFFRVKDYGVGLDHEGIRDVYSKYGASSKRGSNDATGMLGLGCKSGLTYTNQFTVVGVKHGVKTTVVVSRNEDGAGTMQVVDTCATDEPNGVEITIPAKNRDFGIKVPQFFHFWPAGSAIINGKPNTPMEYTKVAANTGWTTQDRRDLVIMGGVAYEVSSEHRGHGDYYRNYGVHFYVPMGTVNFTPSREGLHYTTKTIAAVKALYTEFEANLAKAAQAEIETAKTKAEAWSLTAKWRNQFTALRNFNFTYNGDKVPTTAKLNGYLMRTKYGKGYFVDANHYVDHVVYSDNVKIIVNYPNAPKMLPADPDTMDKFEGTRRTRVDRYFTEVLGEDWHQIYIVQEIDDPWLTEVTTYDWAQIAAWKMPRKISANGSTKMFVEPAYDVVVDGYVSAIKKSEIEAMVAAGTGDIVYFSTQWVTANYAKDRPAEARSLAKHIAKLGPVVVLIGENRHEKFLRDFPGAAKGNVWYKNWLDTEEAKMTSLDKMILAINTDHYGSRKISRLSKVVAQIDDPKVVEMVKAAESVKSLSDYAKLRQNYWYMYNRFHTTRYVDAPALPTTEYFSNTYPLVDNDSPLQDVVLYMNAKFATIKDGK